jgi:D-alanyl-D-alanine dipeptidase/CubicO group peptidase (beta-lactamase class C family)
MRSIALVDGDEIVWATGMGFARPADSVPATATTRYRVGGVSQILTAIAVMQLVEQRLVQLDAPVARYVASFGPRNPGGGVTLRQLLAHHSGLLREPPLGGAVDPDPPSLAATVASLNRNALAYPPGSHEKYSNAGAALAGYVIERVTRTPFPEAMARQVLAPVGMAASAFHAPGAADPGLAHGVMWAHDGRRFAAPTFPLGTGPAVEFHTTVIDLARLLTVLFEDGRTPAGTPLLRRESLARMWTPQFTSARATAGAGLGFAVSRWEGHRRVGHDGAVYGFATELAALPDERLGVVVVATLDGANSVTARIADAALRGMLAARAGRPVPEPETTDPVPPGRAARVAGRYVHGDRQLELRHRPAGLFLAGASGVGLAVGARGDTLVVDDAVDWGLRLLPLDSTGSRLLVVGDTYAAAALPRPEPAADRWRGLVGEYGWDHDVLFVYEAHGTLYALIDWFFPYALREIARDTFAFPDEGRYRDERLVFARDAADRATEVVAGGVRFARRAVGPGDGGQLRVTPLAPVAEILAAARAAQPPPQPDSLRAPALTDLAALDSTIRLDVRYATSNNFLGSPFYASARVFLQRPAAEAVVRAHRRLRQRGYGLLIHDGYRPWYVTRAFWDATPPASRWMVANPASGSRHNRGCAVDLTLFDLATGAVVDMGGTYDETTPRSYPDYPVTTALQRWHRELLREALEREGFRRVADEWWHFDYHDWRAYPILNLPFEELR